MENVVRKWIFGDKNPLDYESAKATPRASQSVESGATLSTAGGTTAGAASIAGASVGADVGSSNASVNESIRSTSTEPRKSHIQIKPSRCTKVDMKIKAAAATAPGPPVGQPIDHPIPREA